MSPLNDDIKHSENLLNYIPYTKLISVAKKEYVQDFLTYAATKYSLLPEVAAILPPEQLFNFLFAFAGQTITVPDQKTILGAFRDLDLFISLVANPTSTEINRLASKYQITQQTIKSTVDRVADSLGKPSPIK